MTLAAQLAHLLCEEIEPVPGVVHDPTQPLVLGDKASNNYVVITWDALQKRTQIQSVSQVPGGPILQAILTFSSSAQLLVNNNPISSLAEFQALLLATQQAAATAANAAAAAEASASAANVAAGGADDSASNAVEAANLSLAYAQAPEGTPLPGGGKSSAASAVIAQEIAIESRDLDVGDDVTADETFQSGFLFTERQVTAAGLVTVTIPPGIFSDPLKKARWAGYRLRSPTGSVKFVGAAGGNNLVTPTILTRGRSMFRQFSTGANQTQPHTLVAAVAHPAVVDGEIIAVFHGLHHGTAQTLSMAFSNSGGLTFSTLQAYPANPRGTSIPDYFIVRAPMVGKAAGSFNLSFLESGYTHFQACDWWILEGTNGTAPRFAMETRTTVQSRAQATITALAAQSRVLISGALGAASNVAAYSNMSTNLTKAASGNTNGIADILTSDTDVMKNEQWGVGDGVATADGDFYGFVSWSTGQYKGGCALIAYGPKSVIGGGTVVMNYEGDRDTMAVKNGVAELWFQNDGKTVDVRTPKP